MAPRVIPVDVSDCDVLAAADVAYSAMTGVEPIVDRASVHFYQRSGHSFAARTDANGAAGPVARDGTATAAEEALAGFVLAHATWSGGRPVVRVERLVASPGAADVAKALVEAVVKSAYDAGVYDLVAAVPTVDQVATSALAGSAFHENALSVYVRVLGSRGSPHVQGG